MVFGFDTKQRKLYKLASAALAKLGAGTTIPLDRGMLSIRYYSANQKDRSFVLGMSFLDPEAEWGVGFELCSDGSLHPGVTTNTDFEALLTEVMEKLPYLTLIGDVPNRNAFSIL